MATQMSTITAAETRRHGADLESKLKDLRSISRWYEDLQIDNDADPLDQL